MAGGLGVLAAVVGLVFAVSFAGGTRVGGGWFWDFGNALGFLALGGILFQMIPSARGAATRKHERLGYWALGVAGAHALWFLVGDGAVRVYLQPGAPVAMWLGLGAVVGLALLTSLARMPDRMRVHRRFRTFRTIHRWLGFAVVAAAGLHVGLTGFYLSRWVQDGLLLVVVLACCLGRQHWARLATPPVATGAGFVAVGLVAAAGFLLLRNLGG